MRKWLNTSLVIISLLIANPSIYAQETIEQKKERKKEEQALKELGDTLVGWDYQIIVSSNLSQTALSHWSAGGVSSIAISGLISIDAIETTESGGRWENDLDLAYGVFRDDDEKTNWWKTDDKLQFSSKYGKKINRKWYSSLLLNFKTQFAPGYDDPEDSLIISDFLSPGYITLAAGLDRPTKQFGFFISPATLKVTIVKDQYLADLGKFGVDKAIYDEITGEIITPGSNVRTEFGGYLKLSYRKEIMKNVTLKTKVDFFSNFIEHPENIDIDWNVLIDMKVNKILHASITAQLIYDDDVLIGIDSNNDGKDDSFGPRTQFKQTLAIGISYKL